jgi:hypothetical protein
MWRIARNPLRAFVLLAILGAVPAGAAEPEAVPFSSPRWKVQAKRSELVEFAGRPALLLESGIAWLPDVRLKNGIIEFSIAVARARGFSGVGWRVQDPENFEHFYIRPHQSGNPDANQYTPVFHGVSAWQLYTGEGYSAPTVYRFDQWMRVRVLLNEDRAEVYIDSDKPVLVIADLKRDVASGGLAVISSLAPAYFADFRYEARDTVELKSKPAVPPAPLRFAVPRWQVSSAFPAGRLGDRIDPAAFSGLRWTALAAEPSGITNLARVQGITPEADTVFARITIASARAQTRRLRFGFSDRVHVYLNGELLYAGDDRNASRDYRFLGTIGLFDELPLRLREGRNELWFAVSEAFGGWGVIAAFDSLDGIQLGAPAAPPQ